jgi:hypothetical protein
MILVHNYIDKIYKLRNKDWGLNKSCIIVWGPFCWKCVRVKLYTFIYMHSALTWVQVSVTRTPEYAHWLARFCLGLLIVTERQKYNIQMLVHWLLFSWVSCCDNRERDFTFYYDTKRKNIKKLVKLINTRINTTNQIAWALVFRLNVFCSVPQ